MVIKTEFRRRLIRLHACLGLWLDRSNSDLAEYTSSVMPSLASVLSYMWSHIVESKYLRQK